MDDKLNKLVSDTEFEFRQGFSARFMETLKNSIQPNNAAALLNERLGKLFYWVNIPTAAALLVLMFLFFLNVRGERENSSEALTLSEYVYDYYVSNN